MKKIIYRAESRGTSKLGWLLSRFSFSFADYYDPARMGFGKLRVLNDDIIAPAQGFDSHPHKNMEIITIVLAGELKHKDSTGVTEVVTYGDIQVMSAGSGIIHSEHNNSSKNKLELLQLWIETKEKNIKPRHDKKQFDFEKNKNTLTKIVSGKRGEQEEQEERDDDSLYIHQGAQVFFGSYDKNDKKSTFNYKLSKDKGIFVFVIDGEIVIDDEVLHKRDAIGISEVLAGVSINFKITKSARFIIVEVPML